MKRSLVMLAGLLLYAGYPVNDLVGAGSEQAPVRGPVAPLRKPVTLWTGPEIGPADTMPFVSGIIHQTLHRATKDGYKFLHGAAIIQHKGVFYANWANSPTNENGPHETLQGRRSTDGCQTWSDLEVIGPGFDGPERHSHGILLVHQGELWTICSRFGVGVAGRRFPGLQAEAFVLNEQHDRWESRGVVMQNCWPGDQPVRMQNGNFITGGQDKDGLPVVAISHGNDLTRWDTISIPYPPELAPSFAETTVWADGTHVLAVIRGGGGVAWVATSDDSGCTWNRARKSNLPMPRAKAYLGKLSTGQLYLLSNLQNRDTLVISVSRPGELTLSRMWRVRSGRSDPPRFPGAAKSKQWSYPYGYEYDGKLYVVYSIGKEDCGLSILPVESLQAESSVNVGEPGSGTSPKATAAEPVSYDTGTGSWLFNYERIVARNDVVYTGPATTDWQAMPTGGGDLWTLVRGDGDLHLRLYKSDNWNGSLGNVHIDFGPQGKELAAQRFHQRLDLYHGKVVIHLTDNRAGPHIEVWGHPTQRILVIEVSDPESTLGPARITLSEPRNTVTVGRTKTTLWAKEIHTTPAGPGLVNTGMQDYFRADNDPMLNRGTAVAVGTPAAVPLGGRAENQTATMTLPEQRPGHYHIIISAVVSERTDPLQAAQRQLERACSTPLETLKEEHQAWWRHYWAKSFLCLESLDQQADWLTAAYHVHLYTLACLNRGQVPHNYDGGGPIMDWVQEVRFIFNPLYAANRMAMVRLLPDCFSRMVPYMQQQTKKVWGVDGLWVPECYYPWGHTRDIVLKDDGRDLSWLWHRRQPEKIPYGLFDLYNNHTGFIFTSGLEISHYYLAHYRYSGDEAFLRDQAYPFLRGVCEFMSNILRQEDDGNYHLDPANALETWWMVRDPADTLDGIRAIFPEFIRLSEAYNLDADLRRRCQAILAALPRPSIGKWYDDGRVDPTIDAYAPAAGKHDFKKRINAENPALYRVYPFGLSGIGTADYERAKRTFEVRTSPLWYGWSMDAIWAARLGLADEACTLLVEHARRFNVFPYGGWHFYAHAAHDKPFPPNRDHYKKPFLDAGGCSATALNEILLQSHHGVIRVAPAIDKKWSGVFQLRAEGGFLVAADVHKGCPRLVEIRSVQGKRCRMANPWQESCVLRKGPVVVLETDADEITFETVAGEIYVLERAGQPVSGYPVKPVESRERFWRERVRGYGLPGRD